MDIENDNLVKLNKYKINPPHPSYLAGLIDGDGCIFIRKIKDGYQSGISITQSRTNILQIIQYHYGGIIIPPSKINTENIFNEDGYYDKNNKRNSYTLIIRSNEYNFLLEYIHKYIILKINQINALMEFSKIVNKINIDDKKEELYKICSNSNLTKDNIHFDYSRLNINYIQGLFDAEGHIFISYKKKDNNICFTNGIYMKITQKTYPEIINKIYEFLNFGKKSEYIYYVDTFEECKKLVKLLKNDLIIKYNQIEAFQQYLDSRLNHNQKYSSEIHLKREKLYKIINMEKHQIEIYDLSKKINNEGYQNKLKEKEDLILYEKELKKQELCLIKSESMKGENNPNYGKHLSSNHSLNISIETTKAKRANNPNLTDDKIREIYDLKGNMLQKDVAEKYNMNREIIRRIWNKIILPLDSDEFIEKKQEKISKKLKNEVSTLTNAQKTSLGKRTLTIDEYIEILNWKMKSINNEKLDGKKIFSTTLATYLSKEWNKNITNDMIKNLWLGRTKLFDYEFNGKEMSYETYLEIIS